MIIHVACPGDKMGARDSVAALKAEFNLREQEIDALLDASRAVLNYKDFKKTARIIFNHACSITGATSGYIALLTDDGLENEVLFLESGGLPCSVDPNLPMPIRGLRAEAYATGKVVVHNNFIVSEWINFMPAGHVELRNVLFAPLTIDGVVRGIMGLANKEVDFTERDLLMAGAFGEFAAIALRNSRMLDQLNSTIDQLVKALAEVKTLRGIIPICSSCKKVRTESGVWQEVEIYVSEHSEGDFSHGLCQDCVTKLYGIDVNSLKEPSDF